MVGLFNRFGVIADLLVVACLWFGASFVWFVGAFCWFLGGLAMVAIAVAFCFAVSFVFGGATVLCCAWCLWVAGGDASLVVFDLLLWFDNAGLGLFGFFGWFYCCVLVLF